MRSIYPNDCEIPSTAELRLALPLYTLDGMVCWRGSSLLLLRALRRGQGLGVWSIFLLTFALRSVAALSEKPILTVAPSLGDLGEGWTTNLVAYLIDPKSAPSEIDYRTAVDLSVSLNTQREAMKTNGRTGCALVFYGHGDLISNSGLYRVYIQRWKDVRSLHNAWVQFKMNPERVVRDEVAAGEDNYWTQEWWRRTLVRQNLVFRRGLFHVVVEAGAQSDHRPMLRLAEVIDAKIRGLPIPPSCPGAIAAPAPARLPE